MSTTTIDRIYPGHLGTVHVSEESSFCTTGTERRCWPVTDSVEGVPTQEQIAVQSLDPFPFDPEDPIQGDKGGTVKLAYYLQPASTVLDAGATTPTDAQAPLRVLLRCLFGGESIAAGSDVATGTSSHEVTVTSGEGDRLPAGQLCAVDTDATYGLEVCQVRSRATNDLTLYPYLSATPATGRDIINLITYYPTRSNTKSLSVGITGTNTSRQWRFNGCTGGMTIKLERNALAVAEFDLKAATHTGPGSLSLATTRTADSMAEPLAVRNSICILQACSTTTRVNTAVEKFSATLNFGMSHLTGLTGVTEGKRGTFRSEGLPEAFAKYELEMPDNADVYTWYSDRTQLSLFFIVKVDTASGRRFVVVHSPQCVISEKPVEMKGEGNLAKVKVSLFAKLSDQCTGTLDNAELATAPFLLGIG
jgi:hypothetical protein